MRIGVDLRPLLTGQISGIELYTISVLSELLTIDHNNTYVLFYVSYRNQDQHLNDLLSRHPVLKSPNVEIRKLKWPDFPVWLHFCLKTLNWPKADQVCGGLDVMWMPSPRLLPLSGTCAKVTTFHDLIIYIFPQFFTLKSRLWQWQMNYPHEAETSDTVIAVSKTTKQDIVKLLRTNPSKIKVIYEGVDRSYFNSPDEKLFAELKTRWNLPKQYIYFVGSVEPRKNLVTVVRALKELRGSFGDTIKLVVSGGKSWLDSDLYKQIDELGLKDSVIFTGRVSEAEKITFLNHAFVFAFPSFYEGFGLMILEAFAAGCPVITSDNSALPEVAGDAGILIDATDVSQLATEIHNLLNNPARRDEMITRGREIAHQFTWEATARRTLEVIQQAVINHGR
jgi:glycosyltransferase involved in cell wall biosynthesis